MQQQRENAQWLRFAEAAMQPAQDCHSYGDFEKVATYASALADAMLEVAKDRGRI